MIRSWTCRWCGVAFIGGTGVFDSARFLWSEHTWVHYDETMDTGIESVAEEG
jgi:hypothetical protein